MQLVAWMSVNRLSVRLLKPVKGKNNNNNDIIICVF